MKSHYVARLVILTYCALLQACAVNDLSSRAAAQTEDENQFRKTAEDFLRYGSEGNVDGMLRLTSPLTVRGSTTAHIKSVFAKNTLPILKGASVELEPIGVPLVEPDTSWPEYAFSGVANGAKVIPISIFIGKEAGSYYVVGLKFKHYRELESLTARPLYQSGLTVRPKGKPHSVRILINQTPMGRAILFNRIQTVKELIANGIDLEEQDTLGETPVVTAASMNHFAIVNLLLQAGASPTNKGSSGLDLVSVIRSYGASGISRWSKEYGEYRRTVAYLEQKKLLGN